MNRASARFLGAALLLFTLVACSNGDDKAVSEATGDTNAETVEETASASPSPTADTDLPSEDDLLTYVEALADTNVATKEQALRLTERGSLAYAYLRYHIDTTNARLDGGVPTPPSEVAKVGNGYRSCTDPGDSTSCVKWGNFQGRNGKIVSLTVNGKSLKPRITLGSGTKAQAAGSGATVEFLSAYQSVHSGDLVVTVKLTTKGTPAVFAGYEATYRGPSGRQSTATEMVGPNELQPKSTSTISIIFAGAAPGGAVSMSVFSQDFMREDVVQIKTR